MRGTAPHSGDRSGAYALRVARVARVAMRIGAAGNRAAR